MNRLIVCLALILALGAAPLLDERLTVVPPAMADDDGDDGDDGDDDGDDDGPAASSGGGGGGDGFDRRRQVRRVDRRQPSRAPAPAPRLRQAPNEVVVLGLSPDELLSAVALGYAVLDQRAISATGALSARLGVPAGRTLEAARAEIAALAPGGATDFNHFYRADQAAAAVPVALAPCDGPHCPAFGQISWPGRSGPDTVPEGCDNGGLIGVIDTGLNAEHESLPRFRLEVVRIAPDALPPSGAMHGTSVASILIGQAGSRVPGLLPRASVIAVDAFHRDGRDERSDVYSLLAALDLLVQRGVRVINLSLSGPPNQPLERLVTELAAQGVVLVAAAGNDGARAAPAYPAAYPGVIAVTAVDRGNRVYRRAVQGDHIDIAAPGVDVWAAASVRGARPRTGTSFAAPFVTAAAYLLLQRGVPASEVPAALFAAATDLGAAGRDPTFGHGVLNAAGLCRSVPG